MMTFSQKALAFIGIFIVSVFVSQAIFYMLEVQFMLSFS